MHEFRSKVTDKGLRSRVSLTNKPTYLLSKVGMDLWSPMDALQNGKYMGDLGFQFPLQNWSVDLGTMI